MILILSCNSIHWCLFIVSCENDWSAFNQSCYKLVSDYKDVEVCREDCKKDGGDLASIHSMEENDFIVSFLNINPIWIAGSITEKDGQFRWIDGSKWDFENWDKGRIVCFNLV